MDDDKQQSTLNWGAFGVAAAGVIQIAAGVFLEACRTSPLAAVGILLTYQGSYDIVFAIRTGLFNTFSWTEYFIEKIISISFTVLSVGVERWLDGGAENAFRRWSATKVARKVSLASARGVTVVCFGKVLAKGKDALLKIFYEQFETEIGKTFSREFGDLHEHIEDLIRLDPCNAENLISDAFVDVNNRLDEDGDIPGRIGSTAFEYLPITVVELALQIMSTTGARDLSDRTVDCVKFATIAAMSVVESRVFARNFMKLLQEAITVRKRQQACEKWRTCEQTDHASVERFIARFKRRVRSFIARRVAEKIRRGLVQATAQSFIVSGIADIADRLS